MISIESKKELRKIMPPLRVACPLSVLALYMVMWRVAPEKTMLAVRASIGLFYHVLPPLCLAFLLIIGLNIFIKPVRFAKLLEKGTTIKRNFLSAIAGIISAGPIYAWYPILKDLREKGAEHSLVAIFLVNRAVKPFLLPVMIFYFGWTYVLTLTLLTMAGSFLVGAVVAALLDHKAGSRKYE